MLVLFLLSQKNQAKEVEEKERKKNKDRQITMKYQKWMLHQWFRGEHFSIWLILFKVVRKLLWLPKLASVQSMFFSSVLFMRFFRSTLNAHKNTNAKYRYLCLSKIEATLWFHTAIDVTCNFSASVKFYEHNITQHNKTQNNIPKIQQKMKINTKHWFLDLLTLNLKL